MTTAALSPSNEKNPLLKVPKITAYFWMAKLLTTAMGEATSDFLVFHTNPYLAVVGCGLLFLAAIWLQMRSNQYTAHYYWFAVIMVSIFGTQQANTKFLLWYSQPKRGSPPQGAGKLACGEGEGFTEDRARA